MPSFWLIGAMAAHAQGNLEEAHHANEEAKRMALAALLQRPDNPEAL